MPKEIKKKIKKLPIYLLAPELKWKAFKELQDRLVRDSGPVPVQGDKALWKMNKKHLIYCWFDPYMKNDMRLGVRLPKNREIKVITNFNLYVQKSKRENSQTRNR